MLRKPLLLVALLLLVVSGSGYLWWQHVVHPAAPAIDFTLTDGRHVSLAQLRGRPVLITFWSVSCDICREEMPALIDLYQRLGPKGLEIIGVAMPYDRPDLIVDLMKQQNITYPIALDLLGQAVMAFNHVIYTPDTFLIDSQGFIVMHKTGRLDMLPLQLQIQALLNNKEKH
jgi:peroxiredoxin